MTRQAPIFLTHTLFLVDQTGSVTCVLYVCMVPPAVSPVTENDMCCVRTVLWYDCAQWGRLSNDVPAICAGGIERYCRPRNPHG